MAAKLTLNLSSIDLKIRTGIQAGVLAVANEAEQIIRGKMFEPKHGRTYKERAGQLEPGPHIASAPGEAPAVLTSELESSLKTQLTSKDTASVISNDPKAPLLEYGTSRIAPRPVFAQTVEEMGATAPETMAREIQKALGS